MSRIEADERASGLEALPASDAVQKSFLAPDRHESNEHIALVYETQAEQLAVVVPFIRQGLERGEKCVYVLDDNRRADLVAAMENGGIDVETAQDTDALSIVASEDYVTEGEFTPAKQLEILGAEIESATAAFPAVRVAVEMTCFLDDTVAFEDLIAYEERYNAVSEEDDSMAICQYNRNRFPAAVVRDTIKAHPHLILDETLSHNVYYTPPAEFFGSEDPTDELDRMTANIEEVAAAETKLQRQKDRLEQFASVVSHDLRNPLTVAQGRLDLLEPGAEDEHLSIVARALDRMDSLIEDLLALARDGESIDELQSVDVESVALAAMEAIEAPDATLVTSSDQLVYADPSRLRQLFENLFRNAIEHVGDAVTVRVGQSENGFYVEDDGPGIPESERDQVFETGFTTSSNGPGLGLNIVREIAWAHGWSIQITAGDSGGARFLITDVDFAE